MTRITYNGPKGKNAVYDLHIEGHTNHEACAALTALWHSFTVGIERLHKLHPNDVKIYRTIDTKTKRS